MEPESFDVYFDGILPLVEKPSRYIGGELNLLSSGFEDEGYNVLLAFPDVYEIGMSYQGIMVLYRKLLACEGLGVEFVFASWPDMEKSLIACGQPLRSMATGTPAAKFDLIGFSLTYELHYTNLLMMLSLMGIPLNAAERDGDCPIVIAGGACTMNPLPIINSLDAVFLGDAEESLPEAVSVLKKLKARGTSREEAKKQLASIEGVFVKGYSESAKARKYILPVNKKSTPPYMLPDIESGWSPVVPSSRIVHDRLVVEVQRGCSRGCRFCQAGMLYRPCRERNAEGVAKAVEEGLDASGWEEVSLLSLSTSDYSLLGNLVHEITPLLKEGRTSLSMPSLRPETISGKIIEALSLGKKSGFTIAPEAGSERLRRVINKEMSDGEIIESVRMILDRGWRTVKLYFMIGLPTETDEDLEGIAALIESILALRRAAGRFKLNVTISPFVPKPHTPFQWERQCGIEELAEKESFLSGLLSDGRVNLRLRNPEVSVLEGIMARGDASLWPVLLGVVDGGGRFEGWSGCFNFEIWRKSLEDKGIEVKKLLAEIPEDSTLPWDKFNSGVKKSFLLEERRKAYAEEITEDCRLGICHGCGLCADLPVGVSAELEGKYTAGPASADSKRKPKANSAVSSGGADGRSREWPAGGAVDDKEGLKSAVPLRFRCLFSKRGNARFISHRELVDMVRRALRRTGLPISYSKGFHPHPRISMAPPLSVGMEGEKEFFDFEMVRSAEVTSGIFEGLFPKGILVEDCIGPFFKRAGRLPSRSLFHYSLDFTPIRLIIKNYGEGARGSGVNRKGLCPAGRDAEFEGWVRGISSDFVEEPAAWMEGRLNSLLEGGEDIKDRKGRIRSVAGCRFERISDYVLELKLPAVNGSGITPKDLLYQFMPENAAALVKKTRKGLYYLFDDRYVSPAELVG